MYKDIYQGYFKSKSSGKIYWLLPNLLVNFLKRKKIAMIIIYLKF